MHAVTRLGRVIQQLRSFGDLHASELEALAVDLETAGATDVAARLRAFRDMQRDESQIVVDELVDIQGEARLESGEAGGGVNEGAATEHESASTPVPATHDPAINSPKRARWLAEQAAEVERLKQPISRRHLFGSGAPRIPESPG